MRKAVEYSARCEVIIQNTIALKKIFATIRADNRDAITILNILHQIGHSPAIPKTIIHITIETVIIKSHVKIKFPAGDKQVIPLHIHIAIKGINADALRAFYLTLIEFLGKGIISK
jgi:hypothetical protein